LVLEAEFGEQVHAGVAGDVGAVLAVAVGTDGDGGVGELGVVLAALCAASLEFGDELFTAFFLAQDLGELSGVLVPRGAGVVRHRWWGTDDRRDRGAGVVAFLGVVGAGVDDDVGFQGGDRLDVGFHGADLDRFGVEQIGGPRADTG